MGLAEAIDAIWAVKDAKDSVDSIKEFTEIGVRMSKRDPAGIKEAELSIFTNARLTPVVSVLQAQNKAVLAAKATKAQWPASNSLPAYEKAIKAAETYGHDSAEAKAAIEAYRNVLIQYSTRLNNALKPLRKLKGNFPATSLAATSLMSYGKMMVTAFERIATFPSGQQAEFFVLSRTAASVRDEASKLSTNLKAVQGQLDAAISEGTDLFKQNQEWILFTYKSAMASPQSLSANRKVKGRPRKK
ncbi:MAG TPA: hypothetical protein VLA78_15435 [Paracoccaceae bacterium]|nr:hypothetical protein [Paracoccaceae bacterium]